ncbi:MAG: WD40 repeat domain-containing protein [Lewinellaceae bacterium]|nr:WD40 repeat domain-containing protein [Lewinellaceae bacterium]MCB9288683.1 WD40 repeat domain-containing protein [Lewinellaceae bacterium]
MFKRLFIFTLISTLLSLPAVAQAGGEDEPCYIPLRDAGIRLMNERNFGRAINQFWAALECPDLEEHHDLNQLIKEVQGRWIKTLETEVDRAQKAEEEAEQAQAIAEQAQEAEAEARKEAEANAVKARRSGLLAESLRLSLLSEKTRLLGRKSDALALAFLSLKLSERDTFAAGMRAFAQAVRDSMERQVVQEEQPIGDIERLPGGEGMAVKSGSSIYILDNQGHTRTRLEADPRLPHASAVSDDGNLVLAFSDNGRAQLWNKASNRAAPISGHEESILSGDFGPDNQVAITGSRDNTAKVWSPQGKATATFTGHDANVYGVECAPDSRHFLTRSADGTARIWDQQGNCMAILSDEAGYIYDARFAPSGKQVFTAGASGKVKIWSLQGQLLATCEGHHGAVKEILFLKGGQRIMSRSEDAIKLWNAKAELMGTISHEGPIIGLAFNRDSTLAVTWENGPLAILWDEEGNPLQEFTGHEGAILSAELSPDGQLLLTTATDGTAKLWDRNGNILIDWNLQNPNPAPATFSYDGEYVFTAQQENKALMACPTPYSAYERMAANTDALAQKAAELKQRYTIQFME